MHGIVLHLLPSSNLCPLAIFHLIVFGLPSLCAKAGCAPDEQTFSISVFSAARARNFSMMGEWLREARPITHGCGKRGVATVRRNRHVAKVVFELQFLSTVAQGGIQWRHEGGLVLINSMPVIRIICLHRGLRSDPGFVLQVFCQSSIQNHSVALRGASPCRGVRRLGPTEIKQEITAKTSWFDPMRVMLFPTHGSQDTTYWEARVVSIETALSVQYPGRFRRQILQLPIAQAASQGFEPEQIARSVMAKEAWHASKSDGSHPW